MGFVGSCVLKLVATKTYVFCLYSSSYYGILRSVMDHNGGEHYVLATSQQYVLNWIFTKNPSITHFATLAALESQEQISFDYT